MNFNTVSRRPKSNQRAKSTSAVAAVAYALTTSLTDERLGKTFNYAHGHEAKAKNTHDMGLYLPGGTRIFEKGRNRQGAYSEFWSKVELKEKRKDSRTARTIVVALPVEMGMPEHQICLEKFQYFLAKEYGMASQVAIHYDHRHNPHAHIITTTRTVTRDGELGEKIRVLDSARSAHFEIKKIGQAWAEINNEILIPKYGTSITHESYEERGIDKPKGEHLGPVKWRKRQAELAEIEQDISRLENELNGLIQEGNNAKRRTNERISEHGYRAIHDKDRNENNQDAPGRIPQIGRGKRGEFGKPILPQDTSKERSRDQQMDAGSSIYATISETRNGSRRTEAEAFSISNEDRQQTRSTFDEAISNHGRRTSTTKRSIARNPEPANRDGQPCDESGNNREAEILKKLEYLNNGLTMLADYWEMKLLKEPIKPDIFARINNALDAYQALTELDFIRRLRHGKQPEQPADSADTNSYTPTKPKA